LSRRMEDLPLLQRYFIEKYAREYNKDVHGLTRRAQARLAAYPWPGNVRELENAIANACMMLEGTTIDVKDLPDSIMNASITEISNSVVPLTMEKVQEKYLLDVLAYTGGNKAKAAEILDISRETVYSILARIAQRSTGSSSSEARQPSGDKKLSISKIDSNRLRKL
jgi:DNA-binding NtrC family response regulator